MLTKLPKMAKIAIFLFLCLPNLLFRCDDIEANPGPKYSSLTFCNQNLNGITAHDLITVLLFQVYITQHCLSEIFQNYSIQFNTDRINGYNLIRADYPSDSKRGASCIYYNKHIPQFKRKDICTSNNCLVTEICWQDEKCFLTCIFHSPRQSHDEFEEFCIKISFTSE